MAAQGVVVVDRPVALTAIREMAEAGFGDMVKGVADVELGVMALGGDLHADEEAVLLDRGSSQADLWGFNLYPEHHGEDGWIEYDSLINIRPRLGNRSRDVEDPVTRQKIAAIVARLVAEHD